MKRRNRNLAALASGLLFGAGLALSQMINPLKIMNFLDVTGQWDPSLALVLLSALAVTAAGYHLVMRKEQPLFEGHFHLPTRQEIDLHLIVGALIFGVGWGLAGYCPGPGIAAMTLGSLEPVIFTLAVFGGFQLHRVIGSP